MFMQFGVLDVLNRRFTGKHIGKHRCNGRITQTHLLKFNGRVSRMSLGSSFQRDLLYTTARLPKKARDTHYTGFYTGEECLTNDVGNGLQHLLGIPYDAFCVTI